MFVYAAQVHLGLTADSLKEKRGIVKSILSRSRNTFNVAAAEVDLQDLPEVAVLAFVAVSSDKRYARNTLERLEDWLVESRPDLEVMAVQIDER